MKSESSSSHESECNDTCCCCTSHQSESDYRREILLVSVSGIFLLITFIVEFYIPGKSFIGTGAALISLALTAVPILTEAVSGLLKGQRNVCELAGLAIIGAVIIGEYTTAAEISLILAIGELVESYVYARSQKDIEGIIKRNPRTGYILKNGETVSVDVNQIQTGDLVVVRPGDIVPVDGIITQGKSGLDESCLTGESLPVFRNVGDFVSSGSINIDGILLIETLKQSSQSTYAQVVDLVQKAGLRRPPSHPFIDRFSRWYTPFILIIAGLVFFWSNDLVRAIAVLIVACPCAILLATPSAVLAAIGHAAKKGILIKRGEYLEICHDISAVIFDKTGTLSTGVMSVSDILPEPGYTTHDLLEVAGYSEQSSPHPTGKAIVRAALQEGISLPVTGSGRQYPGEGIEDERNGERIYVGTRSFLEKKGIIIPKAIVKARVGAETPVFVAKNGHFIGIILISDNIRDESADVIARIRSSGIRTIAVLTGDSPQAAAIIGEKCGLPGDSIHAGVHPDEKLKFIERLQADGKKICFVGDGTNDGPALAGADLGISIASREDTVALETAGVVLMQGGLIHLPDFLELSRKTRIIIITGVSLALTLNFVMISGASLGLISPAVGAIGHQISTIAVLLNSLRMRMGS